MIDSMTSQITGQQTPVQIEAMKKAMDVEQRDAQESLKMMDQTTNMQTKQEVAKINGVGSKLDLMA